MTMVLATQSQNKVKEISRVLTGYDVVSLSGLGITEEPEETGVTFLENARIKARAAMEATGLPALADDSGLCVDALDGAPGVWSKEKELLWPVRQLEGIGDRRARFVCQLVLLYPDGREILAGGICEGEILHAPRGENGFGFDPIFLPEGYKRSMAELTPEEKDGISHRGRALRALAEMIL
jgi:XTP/dITP diphosphohydrolase